MLHRTTAFPEIMPLVLLMLMLLLSATSTQSTPESDSDHLYGISAEFSPKNPLFASGSTMELNCTLRMRNSTPPSVTAHQVHCTFGSANLTVVVLDDNTFKIRQENLTRNMSLGHVFCYLNVVGKPPVLFAQVSIRVADIPVAPNITSCVVHDWKEMVCTWEPPTQDTGIQTNYTLAWSLLCTPDSYFDCPHATTNACTWKKSDGRDSLRVSHYCLRILAYNQLATVYNLHIINDINNIVMPKKVDNLQLTNVTSQSASVSWTWGSATDHDDLSRTLLFRVNCTSEWNRQTMETTNKNTILSSLVPNTMYTISVECLNYQKKIGTGFWSDAEVTSLLTKEDVPGQAPTFSDGSYLYGTSSNNARIVVFWQPVPRRWLHGRLVRYRVRCFHFMNDSHVVEEKTEREPFSELSVPDGQEDLAVTVEAETTKGYNNSLDLKTLIIPRADRAPAKPGMVHAVRNQSEITAMWSSVSNASGYTVYWCKRSVHRQYCDTSLNWTSVSPDVTSLTISVGSVRHNDFLIAVSVETYVAALELNVSSGMVWAGCVPDITKRMNKSCTDMSFEVFLTTLSNHVKPPILIGFAKEQQAYSLTVEWSKPKCEETAFIVKFEILYCQRQGCGVDACCKNKTMFVENNETLKDEIILKTVIRDLVADIEYEVSMRSISFTENSTYTSPIRRTVHRSGLTAGVVAAVVIAALVLFLLLVVGLVTIAKKIKKCFYCCEKLEIVYPDPMRIPCQNEQIENDQVMFYNTQLLREEENPLLHNGNKQETDASHCTVNIRRNGEDCYHPSMSKSFQPPITDNGTQLPDRDEMADLGVAQSHDSTISSYTHLAVPDESAHAPNKQPNGVAESGCISNTSSDHSPHILPCIVANSPPSQTFAGLEPPVSSSAVTETYMPVEKISLPVGSCTSSTITPYTTVEQTFEMAEPKNFPESKGHLPADAKGDAMRQIETPVVESHDTKPNDCQQIQCPIDDYISGSLAGVSDVPGEPQVNTVNNGVIVTEVRPLYANHEAPMGEDGYSDQRDMKPLLPVSYIPLAPTLST